MVDNATFDEGGEDWTAMGAPESNDAMPMMMQA